MNESTGRRRSRRRRRKPRATAEGVRVLLDCLEVPANPGPDWLAIAGVLERSAARYELPVPWLGGRVPPRPPLRLVKGGRVRPAESTDREPPSCTSPTVADVPGRDG